MLRADNMKIDKFILFSDSDYKIEQTMTTLLANRFKRSNPYHRRSQTETSNIEQNQSCQRDAKMKTCRQERKLDNLQSHCETSQVQKLCLGILLTEKNGGERSKIRKMSFGFQKSKLEGKQNCFFKTKDSTQRKSIIGLKSKKVSFLLKGKESTERTSSKKERSFVKKISQRTFNALPDFQTWRFQIKKIIAAIEELKSFGMVQKKLNNWCRNYFESKKKGLTDIFMKKILKKKSLNNEIFFYAISSEELLMHRIGEHAENMSQKERYFLGIEICLYRNFLEQKIANKHRLELNQLQNRVKCNIEQPQTRQLAKQLYQYESPSIEITNFFSDLQRIEESYGQLSLISLKNRKRHENMNKSQSNIRKFIYN